MNLQTKLFPWDSRYTSSMRHTLWQTHRIGDYYRIKGDERKWQIAYYPIFENGKTQEKYDEPRALVETPIKGGIDFREIPLRYLTRIQL